MFAVLKRLELSILLTVSILAGIAWVFLEVTEEVMEGDTQSVDEEILLSMRTATDLSDPIGPHWLEEMMRDITGLGGVGVLTFLTLTVTGYLLLEHKFRVALLVLLVIGSGIGASLLLKKGYDRPRPQLVPHESYVYTSSFPSGHSMMSALVYLTLASMLARVQTRRRAKIYLIALATFLTLIIGISRVYMGVHWPSDVLAGWVAGAFWAIAGYVLMRRLQHQGAVEQKGVEPQVAADDAAAERVERERERMAKAS